MEILYIVLPILVAIVLILLCISYITFRMAFYSKRKITAEPAIDLEREGYKPYKERTLTLIEALGTRPYESISVKSHDGLILAAKYYRGEAGHPIHIMFHGYRSAAGWDFCGGAEERISQGDSVILPDQRGHGKSEGSVISFGVNERFDAKTWCEYADKNIGGDIFIWGISMGAATVLMTSALPLPSSVKGILADCPYSSPKAIITRVADHRHLPGKFLFPLVRLGALIFGRFRLKDYSPELAVKFASVPILLIHGSGDDFVPSDMSDRIAKSAMSAERDIELHIFEDAAHGMSYFSDSERYRDVVNRFLQRCLK